MSMGTRSIAPKLKMDRFVSVYPLDFSNDSNNVSYSRSGVSK